MNTHYLKTWPVYFQQVIDGNKTFEVRLNDRNFRQGDTLVLQEWNGLCYTGRIVTASVTYLLEGGQFGIEEDYCVMAIKLNQ